RPLRPPGGPRRRGRRPGARAGVRRGRPRVGRGRAGRSGSGGAARDRRRRRGPVRMTGAAPPGAVELARPIRARDPVAVAERLPPAGPTVTYTRAPAPEEWLVDGASERPLEEHRAAHAAGQPSEAAVAYGAGVEPSAIAERLISLAALARESGLLR